MLRHQIKIFKCVLSYIYADTGGYHLCGFNRYLLWFVFQP